MILEMLKAKSLEARRANREIEKNILMVAINEIYAPTRKEVAEPLPNDEQQAVIIRKIIKSNEQMLAGAPAAKVELRAKLEAENKILADFLPKVLSKEEIKERLQQGMMTMLKDMPNIGKAKGLAIQFFKSENLEVSGKDVSDVVQELLS